MLVQDVLITDLQRPDLSLYGLHHDSHEAFAGDLPSPLKAKLNEEGGGAYDRLCDRLDLAISEAFGFSIPSKGDEAYRIVKRADQTALLLEARLLLHDQGADGVRSQLEGKGVDLSSVTSARELETPLTPDDAETQFLDAHVAAVADSAGTR